MATSDRAFEAAAETQHSQGILGLVRPREWTWGRGNGRKTSDSGSGWRA